MTTETQTVPQRLWEGVYSPEQLHALPNSIIGWALNKLYFGHHTILSWPKENVEGVIREARRRNFQSRFLENLDPRPCACGKKGLYIVGRTTYCRQCVQQAKHRLRTVQQHTREVRANEKEKQQRLFDNLRIKRDNLKNVKKSRP